MGCSYIVKSSVHLPKKYKTQEIVDKLYHEKKTRKLARRFTASTGIVNRFVSINLEDYPSKKVLHGESPVEWLSLLYNDLLGRRHANFLSLSYNISSHDNFVPSISSQLCSKLELAQLMAPPEEHLFMGCSSAIFSINSAVKYCNKHKEDLAFIASYEQSSWLFNPENERSSPDFVPSLRGHALFGDGAAGLIIAGEEKAMEFENKALIIDTQLSFSAGSSIGMKGRKFLVGDRVDTIMPDMVAKDVILPLLRRNNLKASDVEEWSIHQGSHSILDEFKRKDILGLTEEQLKKSHDVFSKIGNVSSPSCIFVLNDWLKERVKSTNSYGMIVGFGAGYYMGAVLYKRV
ncbi:3-oxoacyl-[acyl-carrier-protein] synthase III C-terminal domain-containing protein [Enterobacter cancerogenus]